MDEQKIVRINELYHKSKAEGLTEAEKKEQQILRREYVDAFRQNLRSQLDQISIREADGRKIWKQKGKLDRRSGRKDRS